MAVLYNSYLYHILEHVRICEPTALKILLQALPLIWRATGPRVAMVMPVHRFKTLRNES